MNLIDYLLVFALLSAALYALYAIILGWLRTPLRTPKKADKTKQSAAGAARPGRAESTQRSAAVHAFSR